MIGVVYVNDSKKTEELRKQSILSLRGQTVYPMIVVVGEVFEPGLRGRDAYVRVEGNQQKKRNAGWDYLKTITPVEWVFFADCDCVFKLDALEKLQQCLVSAPDDVGYAYCDYRKLGRVTGTHLASEFTPERLAAFNFASTMSLIRRSALEHPLVDPPFKEEERRLQDWSLWLRLFHTGYRGVRFPEELFFAHYDDGDVSVEQGNELAYWTGYMQGKYVHGEVFL